MHRSARLSVILAISALAFSVVKWAGAAYPIWIKALRSHEGAILMKEGGVRTMQPMGASMHPQSPSQTGLMAYPNAGWRRFVFKLPLHLWRLGLGRFLPSDFLVLTTTGRKSGLPRHTMLEHAWIGENFYIGSGWGRRSDWGRNLEANPLATVQTMRAGVVGVRASHASDAAELSQVYHAMRGKSPAWEDYLAMWGVEDTETDFIAAHQDNRLLTYRLSPVTEETPPPLPADLRWIWGWMLGALAVLLAVMLVRRAQKKE